MVSNCGRIVIVQIIAKYIFLSMKVSHLKKKFVEVGILLAVVIFAVFALGFRLGNNQRGFVVTKGQTSALGLAPVVKTQEEVAVLDLNMATAEELATLPGIGEKLASTIVAFREEHGAFSSVWELTAIDGIGERKLNAILPYLKIT